MSIIESVEKPSTLELTYVHDLPIPSRSANAVQVVKMCQAFRNEGVDVRLLAPRGGDIADRSHAALARLYELKGPAFRLILPPVARMPGRMRLLSVAAAALSGHHSVIYSRSIAVAANAIRCGQEAALELHQPPTAYRTASSRLNRLARSPRLRRLVVISERLKQSYLREFPGLRGRIIVAHDGADPVLEKAPRPEPLGCGFKIGYVGHLYDGKGMEIIASLAPTVGWATFHIIGGTDSDIARWQSRLGRCGNVVFHGHVPHAKTKCFVASMDVVLAPYQRVVRGAGATTQNLSDWMSPLKVFEYMSQGKAIVASDLPVLREILNETNAVLKAPEDIAGWAAALRSLRSASLRARIGRQAKADFETRYTWQNRAARIMSSLNPVDKGGPFG